MSQSQRAAADAEVSAWVTASAGTGKTHVLTSRVLRLLLAGTPPERILCLTFTNAAAAEMANRLQATLARWVMLDDGALIGALENLGVPDPASVLPLARRLFTEVLEVPGGLKIQTIHSFCQSLLARFPLEANLPPHFRLIDERSAAEALRAAVDAVLLRAADRNRDPALAAALDRMARRLTEHSFQELVSALIMERSALERLTRRFQTHMGMALAVRRRLGLAPDESSAAILEDFRSVMDRDGLAHAAEALSKGGKEDGERAALIRAWLSNDAPNVEDFRAYCRAYLTDKGEPRKRLMTKGVAAEYPDLPDFLAEECERVQAVRERLALVEVAENTEALLVFGLAALASYDQEKRRQVALDYDDLILTTLALLEQPDIAPWVLFKLDGGLDHVLVDEAQDTNPEQWRVIEALANEFFTGKSAAERRRTIFAVGDVKQSIYSFQRADPREFLRAKEHFRVRVEAAMETFRDVALDLSFRSVPAVLNFVDAVFTPEELRGGLLDDSYRGHNSFRAGDGGWVELWETEKPEPGATEEEDEGWLLPVNLADQSSADARLALRIARHVRRMLDEGVILESRGTPIRPGDILILVRRRTAFDQLLLSALKFLEVPVAGADRMVVTDQIAVMDLMALGAFALLPEDDLNLAALLKSPLVGLGEDDLYDLAQGREEKSLWQALLAHPDPRFDRARRFLTEVLNAADYLSPHDFFARFLTAPDATGRSGRERILARLGPEAHDPLDEFLGLTLAYEASHAPSLQGLLHWLAAREVEIKRDMEQGQDQVRIMTVHGAKGLQAPVVIMPDTCQSPDFRDRLVDFPDPKGEADRFVLWPGRTEHALGPVGAARDAMKERARQEYLRLLYVALTRAADCLVIAGWETKRKPEDGCWYNLAKAAFDRLAAEQPDHVTEIVTPEGPVRRYALPQKAAPRPPAAESAETAAAPFPAFLKSPPPPEPVPARPLTPSRPDEAEPPVQSPLRRAELRAATATRFKRGTLIHRLLERLPALAPVERRGAALNFLKLSAPELDGDEAEALVGEVMAVLTHPDFAPLFAPGSRAEVALAGIIGTTPIAGQVDRLAITEDEVLVVDYKTNRPPPRDPADVPPAYLRQMAGYVRLLRGIYPDRRVRAALLWTDIPHLMELDEALLDGVAFQTTGRQRLP